MAVLSDCYRSVWLTAVATVALLWPLATAPAQTPAANSPADKLQRQADASGFKPIADTGVDIALPAGGEVPRVDPLRNPYAPAPTPVTLTRPWPSLTYTWAAAATRHNPLYFEEVNAERYGYTCSRVLQPAISTAHFFGTIPALPYLHGANCPWECQYTLGHYRPGSCNPWRRHCWPLSARGALYQAGVVTGVTYILP